MPANGAAGIGVAKCCLDEIAHHLEGISAAGAVVAEDVHA